MKRSWMIEARLKKDMEAQELAKLVGATKFHISKIENGKNMPSVKLAKKIGKELEINWTWFFEE